MEIARQLEMLGLEETRRQALAGVPGSERGRILKRVDTTHELMSALPGADELGFLHSGLCQTCLPHRRPVENHTVWTRTSGRFALTITPGVMHPTGYVGVPYGPTARLILIHLQTEGVKSRTVNLGSSLSAFLRSLGKKVTGGKNGTITSAREQALRIARCSFALQWSDGDRTQVTDTRIVDGLDLWRGEGEGGDGWNGTVQLSERFHAHLQEHAVPLDKRAIGHLSVNSLGLDLYVLFAYRLPRLKHDVHLRWNVLQEQVGSDEADGFGLARRVRKVMPDVMAAYPHAKIEVTPHGITLRPSLEAVPKTAVRGFRLVGAT